MEKWESFIGKMGEVAFFNFCKKRGVVDISEIDYGCYSLGQWDNTDFHLVNKKTKVAYNVAVKSTKHFGNLLLLECKD